MEAVPNHRVPTLAEGLKSMLQDITNASAADRSQLLGVLFLFFQQMEVNERMAQVMHPEAHAFTQTQLDVLEMFRKEFAVEHK